MYILQYQIVFHRLSEPKPMPSALLAMPIITVYPKIPSIDDTPSYLSSSRPSPE